MLKAMIITSSWFGGILREKHIISFFIIKWFLIVKPRVPFTPVCFVPSLVEIGPMVLKKKIFKMVNVFLLFPYYLPLGKGRGPSFEQSWIPFTQGFFVFSLVEIGSMVLEKKIFEFRQYILLFRTYLPLEKGGTLHLNKLESPSPRDTLC